MFLCPIYRAMDFLVELFHNLLEHPDWTMSQACTDSYNKTLKRWHGWLASSSFTVALKLAPERKKFMEVIGSTGDLNADMAKFCTTFATLLAEIHKFLVSLCFSFVDYEWLSHLYKMNCSSKQASCGLDDMKAS
ncbi:hypothetical protein AXF42_Ash003131 [Apostasia shenzhenica]|uniref:Glycolipid transfer protein domain-containing protein n=1 Tax=Apostasia shenzhenica TaxID=1088818 RepID=A0A2I0BF95_9ASPA|nr:hypothetical protein AXF42_Ash003131 [Apostasia shenzhenica]